MKKSKIILVTNIISPSRIPFFNYINQNGNFDFKVVALAEIEKNREWELAKEEIKFDYKILPGIHSFIYQKDWPIHLNMGLGKILFNYRPDIIITSGYDCLAYWQAFFYSKLFRKKYILWNESTLLSSGSTSGIIGKLKRIMITGADRYIACGKKAKEYLEYFGADPKKIYIGLNTVDTNYFQKSVSDYQNSQGFNKESKKFPNLLFLYVGQLIKRKGLNKVLEALRILNDSEIGLLIIGSGSEERALKRFCQENKVPNIYFEGFKQKDELPKYYALSDVFILPSFREVWGLVVNEALASGLYVLCSKYAGAAYDLINDGNGKIFDPHNTNEIVECIKNIKDELPQLRANREKISSWANENLSIAKSGDGFISAIESSK